MLARFKNACQCGTPKCNFHLPGMEKPESSADGASAMDLEDRDPNSLNQHLQHIWCVAPCLRVWKITCAATRSFFTAFVQAIVRPVADAVGYLFNNIRVLNQKLPDGPEKKDDILIV
ncbi:hypothetical protein HZH66_012580 [Vespula vulgaris]|uniref:Caveolin n=1 Tax=Vespula vulgaris TaxID=7454 RepID=A0A834MT71_VESVU|nr:hypothetical protein HZH66_012580 [Vespula vulgaris]